MAGHSKWNNIKNKKGATDKKKGKVFAQLAKNIRTAVKEGKSADANANPALRLALDKARAANMPNENIKRAIERGSGIGKGGALEEILYEGYGPLGVGFLLVVATDNKMRTASEIRMLFDKNGGSLGGPGSVAFMFDRVNNEYVPKIPMPISSQEDADKVEEFFDMLQEHDDVEDVYHNASLNI